MVQENEFIRSTNYTGLMKQKDNRM